MVLLNSRSAVSLRLRMTQVNPRPGWNGTVDWAVSEPVDTARGNAKRVERPMSRRQRLREEQTFRLMPQP